MSSKLINPTLKAKRQAFADFLANSAPFLGEEATEALNDLVHATTETGKTGELVPELFTSKRPPANAKTPRSIVVSTRCGNGACVCPDCAGYMQRGTVIARGLAGMDQATATLRRKRIAETRRSTRVLTDQQAARIKTELSTTARALARELGVNFSVVQSCRNGRTYRDFSASHWQGLA